MFHAQIAKTDLVFSTNELPLLNEGLKYNLIRTQNWIRIPALEAETENNHLPTFEQGHVRYQVANNITNIIVTSVFYNTWPTLVTQNYLDTQVNLSDLHLPF
jgi:hypothetical protein